MNRIIGRRGPGCAKTTAGFTMIEIMIVVAILGLVGMIALPSFMSARTRAQTNICLANLRKIDEAKSVWAMWEGASTADIPEWDDLVPDYLAKQPLCPAGGTYTIGACDASPTCSIHSPSGGG